MVSGDPIHGWLQGRRAWWAKLLRSWWQAKHSRGAALDRKGQGTRYSARVTPHTPPDTPSGLFASPLGISQSSQVDKSGSHREGDRTVTCFADASEVCELNGFMNEGYWAGLNNLVDCRTQSRTPRQADEHRAPLLVEQGHACLSGPVTCVLFSCSQETFSVTATGS